MLRLIMPHTVLPLRYRGRPVDRDVSNSVLIFLFVFLRAIGIGRPVADRTSPWADMPSVRPNSIKEVQTPMRYVFIIILQ